MAPLEAIEWEECFLEAVEDSSVKRLARERLGVAPSALAYLSPCPWLARSWIDLHPSQLGLVHLDPDLEDLVALAVSQDNSCRYCYAVSRTMLRILGLSDERIMRLNEDLPGSRSGGRSRAALVFAKRMSHADPLPSQMDVLPLREAGYGEEAVNELACLVAVCTYFNRVATFAALPTADLEALPEKTVVKICRPILAFFVRRRRRRPRGPRPGDTAHHPPRPPADVASAEAPFACAIAPLGDTPAAAALCRVVDAAWRSPLLPARAKALTFAIVGKALGCEQSQLEARRLLAGNGLGRTEVTEILAHLSSPLLDPVEASLVAFARETVWYQPAQIQRKARHLAAAMGQARFLEVAGLAALANAVCRLGAVLGSPR